MIQPYLLGRMLEGLVFNKRRKLKMTQHLQTKFSIKAQTV